MRANFVTAFLGGIVFAVAAHFASRYELRAWMLFPVLVFVMVFMVAGISYFQDWRKMKKSSNGAATWSWSKEAFRRLYIPAWARMGVMAIGLIITFIAFAILNG